MSTNKISVDLKQRTFSIEVPDERVAAVLDRIEALFRNEAPTNTPDVHAETAVSPNSPSPETSEAGQGDGVGTGYSGNGRTKRRGKGGGKIKTFEPVDLPLSSGQRQELRDFFERKSPKQQNETVAVLAVKLKDFLDKANFSTGEIISALRIVNKPVPKNLPAVFGNMKTAGIAAVKDRELIISYLTEDYVNHHMVRKDKD